MEKINSWQYSLPRSCSTLSYKLYYLVRSEMAKNQKNSWSPIQYILVTIIAIIAAIFFSYKLLEVPTGLTVDEAAFGYNAALLSKTYRDENNRFMPVFVLSIHGQDWRQPVTQYYLALLFKIFKPSVFLLRFSSIIIFVTSFFLIIFLSKKIFSSFKLSLFTGIIFATTPLVLIQSHMGLDNIMPIPFTILWILFFYKFISTKNQKFLLFSAIILGINFYTYKGMRATVPIWALLTAIWIIVENHKNRKKTLQFLFTFILGLTPFFGTIPLWEHKYPGSIFNGQTTKFDSIYNFIYPYLSSFDLTLLYIKGDDTPFHSTGIHGMMLLATLPLFILGIFHSVKKRIYLFLLIAFFSAPLLFGFVNSVHRASRLMCIIPIYSLVCTVGLKSILNIKKWLIYPVYLLIFINFFDFSKYYLQEYGQRTSNIFGTLANYQDYKIIGEYARQNKQTIYLDSDLISKFGENEKFFQAAYLDKPLTIIKNDEDLPSNTLLITHRKDIPNLKRVTLNLPTYFLQTR